MTGFGKAEKLFSERTVTVELRSLNGKQFDARMKIPNALRPFEMKIRKFLKKELQRGSLDVSIQLLGDPPSLAVEVNKPLAKKYFQAISAMAEELGLPKDHILGHILEMPDVVHIPEETLSEEEFAGIMEALSRACADLVEHRRNEGKALEKDLLLRINNIEEYQREVAELEPIRKENKRDSLEQALGELNKQDKIDQNRLEQEMIYYIERLDISEEQVRLANHCRYFKEVLEEEETSKGRKLNFILQEMGREINTTGSKANDAEMQRCVVKMKDELDKAKEQILNVL